MITSKILEQFVKVQEELEEKSKEYFQKLKTAELCFGSYTKFIIDSDKLTISFDIYSCGCCFGEDDFSIPIDVIVAEDSIDKWIEDYKRKKERDQIKYDEAKTIQKLQSKREQLKKLKEELGEE